MIARRSAALVSADTKKKRKTKISTQNMRMVLANPCLKNMCKNDCLKVTEIERCHINEHYWGMPEARRNLWLLSCIKPVHIRRRRPCQEPNSEHRRDRSYKYYLIHNGEAIKVCQKFILRTLNISQIVVRHALLKESGAKQRRKRVAHNKTNEEHINLVKKYIEKLPAVPSHYCRSKCNKVYIPQEFRNVANLYKCYEQYLKEQDLGSSIVSLNIFRKIFKNDFSIGFHLPKKDKCITCENVKNLNAEDKEKVLNSDALKIHLKIKDEIKGIFLKEQTKTKSNPQFLCASFDMQKVLNTPFSKNVTLFYSRKYAYYNLSVYESGTRNGFCFLWGERDGKRGCNEICTALLKYLLILDSRKTTMELSLYCDSCAGQNKNKAVLSMLAYFLNSSKCLNQITITYLLPGHTMMPVDSVHSTIESFVRNRTIWAPSEWPTVIRNARTNPWGYECIKLSHNDFYNWKLFADSLLPINIKLNISKLRIATLKKNPVSIELKYNYVEDFNKKNINNLNFNHNLKLLYPNQLSISTKKYIDLKNLCAKNSIPPIYHSEYLNLPHSNKIKDTLQETDNED